MLIFPIVKTFKAIAKLSSFCAYAAQDKSPYIEPMHNLHLIFPIKKQSFFLFWSLSALTGCAAQKSPIQFTEVSDSIGLITKNNWKYGGPTIADINGDGYYDLLLGNHDTTPAQLFWANGDTTYTQADNIFSKADLHGMAAGDYDGDGDLDILLSLGGGNGQTPQPQRLLRNDGNTFTDVTIEAGISEMGARGRVVRWVDLDGDGDLDFLQINAEQMVNEEIPRNILFENLGDGIFTYKPSPDFENINAERVLITDFNRDLIPDLLTFSPYGPTQFWKGNTDFTFTDVSAELLPKHLQETSLVMTACEVDIDNDGDLDYYLARGKSHYLIANNAISFDKHAKRLDLRDEGNKSHDGITLKAGEEITLTDFYHFPRGPKKITIPVFLGKDKLKIDTPKTDTKISAKNATGFPTSFEESGWYLGYTDEGTWRLEWELKDNIAWDVRASILGVLDYVPDWKPQNLGVADVLLRNDGDKFTDISTNLPKESMGNNWGVTSGDFDNDGYNDLFVYRFGELRQRIPDALFHNVDGTSFQTILDHGANVLNIDAHGDMGTAFDYNLDGKLDLLNGDDDNGKWHMYENRSANPNHYILVQAGYAKSGVDAIGAELTVTTKTGSQFKRVGSGSASHAQCLLNTLHFGLGQIEHINSISITWRDGSTEVITDLKANQLVRVGKTSPNSAK